MTVSAAVATGTMMATPAMAVTADTLPTAAMAASDTVAAAAMAGGSPVVTGTFPTLAMVAAVLQRSRVVLRRLPLVLRLLQRWQRVAGTEVSTAVQWLLLVR